MATAKGGGGQKGLLWRLPEISSKELGKIGPAFGLGIGCGAGAGIGFFGGAGLGYGFPGLTVGFGVGAGCGVGFGFGYGLGKGIAYDETKKHSNVGKMFQEAPKFTTEKTSTSTGGTHTTHTHDRPHQGTTARDTVAGLFDELVVNTKKLATATSKQIEKWH